ncbi:AP-2 complex subunit mu [Artemisia annua]|uniref:AP-2 complex subunit mu n=1 Tax=Artemisia annua TaxID=35608 RepID=A0A2U1LNM4_ARTAN|nr:AP-2 complex subunit mu [Artemisia annua]
MSLRGEGIEGEMGVVKGWVKSFLSAKVFVLGVVLKIPVTNQTAKTSVRMTSGRENYNDYMDCFIWKKGVLSPAAIGTSDSSIRMPAKRLASQGVPGSCSRSQGSTRNVWQRVAKRVSQNHPQPRTIPFQVLIYFDFILLLSSNFEYALLLISTLQC